MNYLAHAYLSFNEPAILAGNMISDFVKGKKQFGYAANIQQGIKLHRAIDAFTDEHAATKAVKNIFRPAYRLYCGAFIDVVYDHFLAIDVQQFPGDTLHAFSLQVYATLDAYQPVFPARFLSMYPYMKQQNWLYNYRLRSGIERSFGGLMRRSAYITETHTACRLFEDNYETLRRCYADFFPDVKQFAFTALSSL